MGKISIVVADDHRLVRDGVRKVLAEQPDMIVLDEAADGVETVEKVLLYRPDIALIDIAMPRLSGLEAARQIRNAGTDTRMIIFSIHKSDAYVYQALHAGALGYVLKPSLTPGVIEAVRAVHRGEYFLSPKIDSIFIQTLLQNCPLSS